MNLSVSCRLKLEALPRANELYGTVGMVHVCGGEAFDPQGNVVPCECPCHTHAKGSE